MRESTTRRAVIILCAGGHAKVVIDAILQTRIPILGIVDIDPELAGKTILGLPVLGGEDVLSGHIPGKILLANGLGGLKSMVPRMQLFERFKASGYDFLTVKHPSCVLGMDVVLSEGVQIMAGAVIQTGARIGDNSIINTRASVDHDCMIGKHVHIAPGATLCGNVHVGDFAYIGSGATVIPGISIGKGVLVRSGSVVTENIADSAL